MLYTMPIRTETKKRVEFAREFQKRLKDIIQFVEANEPTIFDREWANLYNILLDMKPIYDEAEDEYVCEELAPRFPDEEVF